MNKIIWEVDYKELFLNPLHKRENWSSYGIEWFSSLKPDNNYYFDDCEKAIVALRKHIANLQHDQSIVLDALAKLQMQYQNGEIE